MAVLRDRPYAGFNFLVDLGDGNTEGPAAGFQTVGGLSQTVDVIEYRTGNSKENSVIKLPGLTRAGDVTLERGVIGSLALFQWLDEIRSGSPQALRLVTIRLQNEDRSEVVMSWKLLRARIAGHSIGPLHAQASTLPIERLVLACERLELE